MPFKSLFLTLLGSFILHAASAQMALEMKQFEMTIAGTSSLHDWISDATELEATGSVSMNGPEIIDLHEFNVTVSVKAIQSTKGSIMDNKTYKALLEESYPKIKFTMTQVQSIRKDGSDQIISVSGKLTIAGQTKTIYMTVRATPQTDGTIRFTGGKDIRMSDYGISPPTAMMGTLKTGDDVRVDFELIMNLK